MSSSDPRDPSADAADTAAYLDGLAEFAEVVTGQRNSLTNRGFAPESAEAIVVAFHVNAAASEWQKVFEAASSSGGFFGSLFRGLS